MGKQLPDNEATVLVQISSETAPLTEPRRSKSSATYDTLPLVHSSSFDDDDDYDDDTSLLSRGWNEYNLHLDQWPVLVKSLTAFLVLGLGDASAQIGQHLVRGGSAGPVAMHWDCLRSLRFGVFGLVGAPWSHYYYHLLDSALPPTPRPCSWTTALKVFIDQFLQAPIALFFIILGLDLMKGVGIEGEKQDLHLHYWETLVANWKLWLPASILNIAFVEPRHRVLFVNIVFFLWIIVLSVMLNP